VSRGTVWLDYETTGKRKATARIVSIGLVIVEPGGAEREFSTLVNPTVPIPPGATRIHGVTDEMVKDAPRFDEIAGRLAATLDGRDYAGYNIRYDLDVTVEEMRRAGRKWDYERARVIDGFRMLQVAEPRSLEDVVRDLLGERMDGAHDALVDVRAARRVVEALLRLYPDRLPSDPQALHDVCFPREPDWVDKRGKIYWEGTEAAFSFGKHKGKTLREAPRGYLSWVAFKADDFSDEVRQICKDALEGRFPVYQEEEACDASEGSSGSSSGSRS